LRGAGDALLQAAPGSGQVQDQAAAGSAEQSAAEENLGAQRGGLAIAGEAAGALKFSEQVEQQQNAAEGGFGGEELPQAKIIGGQIVFQFGDVILRLPHVRKTIAEVLDAIEKVKKESPDLAGAMGILQ
jgi:hypothetical protein